MKPLIGSPFDEHRQQHPFFGNGDLYCGAFFMRCHLTGKDFVVIATNGDGWDHVSISNNKRPPRWNEMEFFRHIFFMPDEVVMQLHVAAKDHINIHPNCLHLWRPHKDVGFIPLPPKEFV